ncbi:MAG: hypothetical protein ACRYGG_08575 [Janthinobacterium lividum]
MAFTLTSIAPATVCYLGGDSLTLTGTFATGVAYNVRVGSESCISGIAGQGTHIYSYDGATLTAFVPKLGEQTSFDVSMHGSNGDIGTLPKALKTISQFYLSEVFSLRGILPSNYALGARAFYALPNVVPQ